MENEKNNSLSIPAQEELQAGFSSVFQLVDDVVLKNYITRLPSFAVRPLDEDAIKSKNSKIRLFRITEMVYEKDESAIYKFASVFNTVATTQSAVFMIIDSVGKKTNFYLGIRSLSEEKSTQTSYLNLENAMKGQFPGVKIDNLKNEKIKELMDSINYDSLSVVSCVANNKNKDFVGNAEYLQGLEKLALAMQGRRYTAIILANSTSHEQLNLVRQGYEKIYTQLSPYANSVVNYGTNTAQTETNTETNGEQESFAQGTNEMHTTSENFSKNIGEVRTVTEQTLGSKIGSTIGASLSMAGAVVGSIIPGAGTTAGAAIGGAVGGLIGVAISTATNKNVSLTTGGGSESFGKTDAEGKNETHSIATSYSTASSLGLTTGQTQGIQLTIQNKPILNILDRIDKQLERLSEFESGGMWECAAYFMSEDFSVSEVAASTYKSLMSGENSGLEVSAINTWNKHPDSTKEEIADKNMITKYIRNFIHPVFEYKIRGYDIPIMPTNLVSGNELAIHMGLPRKSVCGFPVIEHADFCKEVITYDDSQNEDSILLGKIFNMGSTIEGSEVPLEIESLASHALVVGATGSGKSNTIYKLINDLISTRHSDLSFMIIEPVKGEYKRVFGHRKDVTVLGTNPSYSSLLKINPFIFPKGIHVLEHIDRLIEIFNVCWPMYAAMPAVLKEALLAAYESCGWDMISSTNMISDDYYPSFQDLLENLVTVINESSYSDEVKSNYKGSLLTRVKSLTNGLNGMIFASEEVDNHVLFDTNVVVDLSRIGSQETKSLLMGILVMRLSEHRMTQTTGSNQKLHHITVLEEAHNILKSNTSKSTEDGGNISGKSVEMISNAIAEMRTYGEGFIIADQSPNAVDISAIRNTNTKIIMRLPEESDRRLAGKSASLRDNQLDEIARLPRGVAVVYQNNWIEPVLCKIDKFKIEEKEYIKDTTLEHAIQYKAATRLIINLIIKNRLDNPEKINPVKIENAIKQIECSVRTKAILYSLVDEYRRNAKIHLWKDECFAKQASLVQTVLGLEGAVSTARKMSIDMIGFNSYLNTIVSQKISDLTDDLLLNINHCLLKAYSEFETDGLHYYETWYHSFSKGRYVL